MLICHSGLEPESIFLLMVDSRFRGNDNTLYVQKKETGHQETSEKARKKDSEFAERVEVRTADGR